VKCTGKHGGRLLGWIVHIKYIASSLYFEYFIVQAALVVAVVEFKILNRTHDKIQSVGKVKRFS